MNAEKSVNVGVAAHITAASTNGPRYEATLSSEDRTRPENGVWLCQTCAKLVDNDPDRFPSDLLRRWKRQAEEAAWSSVGKPQSAVDIHPLLSNAKSKFLAAFAGALGSLRSGHGDPFNVLASDRRAHDAAIVEFRYQLPTELQAEFDDAARHFELIRDRTQPGILNFYQRKATGQRSGATVEELSRAIEQLLAFTQR